MGRSYQASKEGVEKANEAFKLTGWSQDYLAGSVQCTRQTVSKFFTRRPVEKRFFQAICDELKLKWREIAELELEEEQSSRNDVMDTARENICEIAVEDYSTTKVLTPPVSVTKKQNANCNEQLVITLTGDIKSFLNNPEVQAALIVLMQKVSKDESLKIDKIEKGSIKISFSGSPEGLKRLEELIKSGNLKEVEGMPVEDVQLLTGVSTDEQQDKFRLVQEIIAQGAKGRNLCDVNLSGVNLSGADLSNADLSCADLSSTDLRDANLSNADLNCADLSGANLSGVDLSGAYLHDAIIDSATRISDKWRLVWEIVNRASKGRDLSEANLVGANLVGADLSEVNLVGADLSEANLVGANLVGADLSGATVKNARFGRDAGLDTQMKLDLERRGAIFDASRNISMLNSIFLIKFLSGLSGILLILTPEPVVTTILAIFDASRNISMLNSIVFIKLLLGILLILAPEPVVTYFLGILVLASLRNKDTKTKISISE